MIKNNLFNLNCIFPQSFFPKKDLEEKASKIEEIVNSWKNISLICEQSEADTITRLIIPILEILGFGYIQNKKDHEGKLPDVWLFLGNPAMNDTNWQRKNLTILEAKPLNEPLDKHASQIIGYINSNFTISEKKQYGILSDGAKWRLYSLEGRDKFIEFDLIPLIQMGEKLAIRQFICMFSAPSFLRSLVDLRKESLESWEMIKNSLNEMSGEIILNLTSAIYMYTNNINLSRRSAIQLLFKIIYVLFIESKKIPVSLKPEYEKKSLRRIIRDCRTTSLIAGSTDVIHRLYELFKHLYTGENGNYTASGCDILALQEVDEILKIDDETIFFVLEKLSVSNPKDNKTHFFDYSSLSVELIGDLYENIIGLEFENRNGTLSIKQNHIKSGTMKHTNGVTYTPNDVVKYVISNTMSHIDLSSLPKICDFACGSGHFLVEAYRWLVKNMNMPDISYSEFKINIINNCIYGNDKDDLVATLCRLMLNIEIMDKETPYVDLSANIRDKDSLMIDPNKFHSKMFKIKDKFDVIVGNPPYVQAKEPGVKEYRHAIKNQNFFDSLVKKWDLWVPFVELAAKATKQDTGSYGLVVSDAFEYAPFAERCRDLIYNEKAKSTVSSFESPFLGWAFKANCLIVNRREDYHKIRRKHEGNNVNSYHEIPWKITYNDQQSEDKLFLEHVLYISVGMVLNADEKTHLGEFEKKDLIRTERDEQHPVRYLDNNDIGVNKIIGKHEKYIEYGDDTRVPSQIRRPTFPELHQGARILCGSNRSHSNRAALLTDAEIIVSQTVNIMKRWCDLIGVENRSINKKITKGIDANNDNIIKKIRIQFENISQIYSPALLFGVIISDRMMSHLEANPKAKFIITPDMYLGFELPIISGDEASVKEIESLVIQLKSVPKEKKGELALIKEISNMVDSLYLQEGSMPQPQQSNVISL